MAKIAFKISDEFQSRAGGSPNRETPARSNRRRLAAIFTIWAIVAGACAFVWVSPLTGAFERLWR